MVAATVEAWVGLLLMSFLAVAVADPLRAIKGRPNNSKTNKHSENKCIRCDLSSHSQQYFMHPSDCTKFFHCSPSGPMEKTCPVGTHWDQSILTCNHKFATPCITGQYSNSDGSCETKVEIKCITCDLSSHSQQYFMHPSDCTKFFHCSPSGPMEKQCGVGTHWDQSILTCNYKASTPCITGQYSNSDGSCETQGQGETDSGGNQQSGVTDDKETESGGNQQSGVTDSKETESGGNEQSGVTDSKETESGGNQQSGVTDDKETESGGHQQSGNTNNKDDWCQMDSGCWKRYKTCRKLMCGTLPSGFKKYMKECALEMNIVLPVRDDDDDDDDDDGDDDDDDDGLLPTVSPNVITEHPDHDHEEHPHHISECGRPFRPNHPSHDGIMQLLDPSVVVDLRKCILTKNGVIKSWDGLVNRGLMLAKLYQPFHSYPELGEPIKEAIETTCQEPVDYEIHDFYRCVHRTCVDNIVL